MIAVDTNLLVFAHRGNARDHQAALTALQPVFEGDSPWALPWPCVHEFIGIATNPGIYKPASTLSEAFGYLDSLMTSPQLHMLAESPNFFLTPSEQGIAFAEHLDDFVAIPLAGGENSETMSAHICVPFWFR